MLPRKERRGEERIKKVGKWKLVLDATMKRKREKEEDENRSEAPKQREEKTAVQKKNQRMLPAGGGCQTEGPEAMRWDRHKEEKKNEANGLWFRRRGVSSHSAVN